MEEKKPLIILTGPTAAGKTETSIGLAKAIHGEIISADSIQVYRYMDIGSAKITKEEMQGIPHYLVDKLYPDEEFNVVIFQKMAREAINQIYQNGHIPIIVGGTGFYIQSILYGIDFDETEADPEFRSKMEHFAKQHGVQTLHDSLALVDKKAADAIHPNNIRRVIRALEYYNQTGQKISDHNETQRKKESMYQSVYFVLNREREILYQRINKRVDHMLELGLVEEVKHLLDMGYQRNLTSMQGLGYKEIAAYLEGEISFQEAVTTIKQESRHFAKRQITWFKREKDVEWISMGQYSNTQEIVAQLMDKLYQKGIIKYV